MIQIRQKFLPPGICNGSDRNLRFIFIYLNKKNLFLLLKNLIVSMFDEVIQVCCISSFFTQIHQSEWLTLFFPSCPEVLIGSYILLICKMH